MTKQLEETVPTIEQPEEYPAWLEQLEDEKDVRDAERILAEAKPGERVSLEDLKSELGL